MNADDFETGPSEGLPTWMHVGFGTVLLPLQHVTFGSCLFFGEMLLRKLEVGFTPWVTTALDIWSYFPGAVQLVYVVPTLGLATVVGRKDVALGVGLMAAGTGVLNLVFLLAFGGMPEIR